MPAKSRCAAIVNQSAVLTSLQVVNLLCVVFIVQRGRLGREMFWTIECLPSEPDNFLGKEFL